MEQTCFHICNSDLAAIDNCGTLQHHFDCFLLQKQKERHNSSREYYLVSFAKMHEILSNLHAQSQPFACATLLDAAFAHTPPPLNKQSTSTMLLVADPPRCPNPLSHRRTNGTPCHPYQPLVARSLAPAHCSIWKQSTLHCSYATAAP